MITVSISLLMIILLGMVIVSIFAALIADKILKYDKIQRIKAKEQYDISQVINYPVNNKFEFKAPISDLTYDQLTKINHEVVKEIKARFNKVDKRTNDWRKYDK